MITAIAISLAALQIAYNVAEYYKQPTQVTEQQEQVYYTDNNGNNHASKN